MAGRRRRAALQSQSPGDLARGSAGRVFASPNRKCTPLASHQAISSSRAKPELAQQSLSSIPPSPPPGAGDFELLRVIHLKSLKRRAGLPVRRLCAAVPSTRPLPPLQIGELVDSWAFSVRKVLGGGIGAAIDLNDGDAQIDGRAPAGHNRQ